MPRTNIEVQPLSPVIGAEIHGVDLSHALDDATFEDIHDALLQHHVIFLPDQRITPADQITFARRFGEIEAPHPVFDVLESDPEITIIEQDGTPASLYNDDWHTDVTFRERPAMASMLHCQVTPPVGGDTGWLSLSAGYDALSEPVKVLIDGLTATHDVYNAFGPLLLSGEGGMERWQEKAARASAGRPPGSSNPLGVRAKMPVCKPRSHQPYQWPEQSRSPPSARCVAGARGASQLPDTSPLASA